MKTSGKRISHWEVPVLIVGAVAALVMGYLGLRDLFRRR